VDTACEAGAEHVEALGLRHVHRGAIRATLDADALGGGGVALGDQV
jgi:hypothetical protein